MSLCLEQILHFTFILVASMILEVMTVTSTKNWFEDKKKGRSTPNMGDGRGR